MSVASSTMPAIGLELVQNAFDADRGDGCAFDGREQRAAQSIADRCSEPALKGLRAELTVLIGECFCFECEDAWAFENLSKAYVSPLSVLVAMHFAIRPGGAVAVRL